VNTSAATRRRPRKSLGQHYLVDGAILSRIITAADLHRQDVVVEVGPGPGSLTRRLVEHAGRVIALEVDPNLAAALPARLGNPDNLTVVEADARTADLAELIGPAERYKVVSNLPYYAANPIIRRFLEAEHQPELMVVMVQREVAQSMLARPGHVTILSMAVQYYATPRLVCNVPPRAFRPPPKVSSSVVRLDLRPEPPVDVNTAPAFFDTVRAGFAAPRKQLRNSLSQGLHVDAELVGTVLNAAGIDGRRRAETLTLEEWARVHAACLGIPQG
jgi:16S rRNA (adenine1518-N6/adenine1519-N6)-dimethyltransferase